MCPLVASRAWTAADWNKMIWRASWLSIVSMYSAGSRRGGTRKTGWARQDEHSSCFPRPSFLVVLRYIYPWKPPTAWLSCAHVRLATPDCKTSSSRYARQHAPVVYLVLLITVHFLHIKLPSSPPSLGVLGVAATCIPCNLFYIMLWSHFVCFLSVLSIFMISVSSILLATICSTLTHLFCTVSSAQGVELLCIQLFFSYSVPSVRCRKMV